MGRIRHLDPLYDRQQVEPIGFCRDCGGELYYQDEISYIGAKPLCKNCFDDAETAEKGDSEK